MKKIVSGSIGTALAITNVATMNIKTVSANPNVDNALKQELSENLNNELDVIVENTEQVNSNQTNSEAENSQDKEVSTDVTDTEVVTPEESTEIEGNVESEENTEATTPESNTEVDENVEVEQNTEVTAPESDGDGSVNTEVLGPESNTETEDDVDTENNNEVTTPESDTELEGGVGAEDNAETTNPESNTEVEENIEQEDNTEATNPESNEELEENVDKEENTEITNPENSTSSEENGQSGENTENTTPEDNSQTQNLEANEALKSFGKLEFDIHFNTPIEVVDSFNIKVFNGETIVGEIADLSVLQGVLDNGSAYEIELLDMNKEPIESDEFIYFAHITVENLDLGTYSAEIKSESYIDTKVDNIEIIDFSKRVILGSSKNSTLNYNGVLLAGDINLDGKVDMGDYQLVFDNLGSSDLKYDLTRDGKVDVADLAALNDNIGATKGQAEIINTDPILDLDSVDINEEGIVVVGPGLVKDILTNESSLTAIAKKDGTPITEEAPLVLDVNLTRASNGTGSVLMEKVVIKVPTIANNPDASAPSSGYVTITDENDVEKTIAFGVEEGAIARNTSNLEDIVIDLGGQVAVKEITITVTGNRYDKNISEIAEIEFLNNVYKEIPEPQMNIPTIKTVYTSTNLHDERIDITWDAQPNVTSYEVTYEKLDENGVVLSKKVLQTNKTELSILDKDIKPYDLYRVSIQSLSGEWSSGYKTSSDIPAAFDGVADNVDSNFNPIDAYYNSADKGSVSEIQVIPKQSPEVPINLTTDQGFKSFTVNWPNHPHARDFDVYYKELGAGSETWTKANEDNIQVTENSTEVTNPNPDNFVRGNSYTVKNLKDNTAYEIKITATNHLGTSLMSQSYIASTVSVTPPEMSEYKLINRPTDANAIGTEHIIDVRNKLDSDGWAQSDVKLTYDTENALVDGDFTTSWKVDDWDTGAFYGSNRGSEITFDGEHTIGSVAFAQTLEQGFTGNSNTVKVTYWDANGVAQTVTTRDLTGIQSNGHMYYIARLPEPITTSKIKVEIAGGGWQTISELRFYEYDSLADDIEALYEDDLRLIIKDTVTQEMIDELRTRLNTQDPVSGDYHPDKAVLEKELEVAELLFNDQQVSAKITTLDPTITIDNVGPSLGMQNSYQSLGSVARAGISEDGTGKKITVYMGSNEPNAEVQIVFLQNYGLPESYMSRTFTIKPGRTEITIPEIISNDVEKGGQVMARVTRGSENAEIQIRLSGVEEIPHLNVNNLINDETKVAETKSLISDYITELGTYVDNLPSQYPATVTEADRANNIYPYEATTSTLNTTDIEGDRFTLTLPATEILKGIESGLEGNLNAQIERVYNALLAWEQEVLIGYVKKGVFEEPQDFNGNGSIDDDDISYFNEHKAPTNRLNVKYQRMMMGAAGYASGHHIGIGFNAAGYMQGVPYKFDESGNLTNANEARLYGDLMAHEMGHVMDIGERLYPETSTNLMTAVLGTMTNNNSQYYDAFEELYDKVTSNTYGLSTNRNVVFNMLWQPHLAYEDENTYEMLLTDMDADLSNDSYFAKLNRVYREATEAEKADADRDQLLIRLTSKVVGKDLSDFYKAHGIPSNATTLEYVSQFPKETRKIQYINDEARRQRLAGTADMAAGTTLTATFGNDSNGNPIVAGSYVNSKQVEINLSVNQSNENILGYEIYRNGEPSGFITKDELNAQTVYVDEVDSMNNRVVTYSATAYDYNLNPTNTVELGTIKIRHEGGIAKDSLRIITNTISVRDEENYDHIYETNDGLKFALDNDNSTFYEGRMLTNSEFVGSLHLTEMNPNNDPYVILDTADMKTLVGLKYTAPTETSGLIFKSQKVASSALSEYRIEVSKDGVNWITVKEGELNLTADNLTETIYFDEQGVEGGNQLASYNAQFVKITALNTKNFAAAELELITPPGDNIEIGVSADNINYQNGIGILDSDYVYVPDNLDTPENEERVIPQGSIIITGEYRGNPAFNVPLVLNQNGEHIADNYKGILLANVPDNGNLEEIAEGNWIYWVEPQDAATFMTDNLEIFAELYRTDSADASEGGQRLVSDTFKIDVPDALPSISLSSGSAKQKSDTVVQEITPEVFENVKSKR